MASARQDTSPQDPQRTALHRLVREHLETFLARRAEAGEPMPPFVEDELRGYLRCGVLAHGAVPSPLLHHLPFVSNLHVPARWQVVCTMYMGLLAGTALDAGERWLAERRWHRDLDWSRPLLPWIVVLLLAADLYVVAMPIVDRWRGEPIGTQPVERPHLVPGYRYHEEYANYPSRNVGTMACYDAVPWRKSTSLWVGDVPQVRIVARDPSERRAAREGDEVHAYERTNHTVTFEVTLGAPGRVIVNQNFEPQWTASTGTIVEDDVRMAVDLPAGRHRVVLRFEPDDLPWSAIVSALGLVLCLLLAASRRRPQKPAPPR